MGRQAGEPGGHLRPPPDTPRHGCVGDEALGAIITSIIGRLCAGSRCWGTEALLLLLLLRSAVHADEELHIDGSLDVGPLVNWRPVHSSLLPSLTPLAARGVCRRLRRGGCTDGGSSHRCATQH